MIRTLTLRVFDEPTRSNSPVSITRSSLVCWLDGTLAISSRNRLLPSASSKRPTRSTLASVKAPRTWPKSSLSKTPSAMPPAFTVTIGRLARGDTAWSACATRLLPVPFSPVMRTLASEGPTRAITSSTGRIAADSASSGERPSACSAWLAASSRRPRRIARPSSVCVRRMASSRSLSHGFWTKSRAPRRIASTATSTEPHAVITTTGSDSSAVWMRLSRSRPSSPDVVSRA